MSGGFPPGGGEAGWELRRGFDNVPELYDRVRPAYPPELFDTLFSLLPPEPEIVEVGPGTGKATSDLLERGARVTGVELGDGLATFLERKLGGNERLRVVRATFEEADLTPGAFDAVVAFTAYHWVQPPARLDKPARILRRSAILAVVDTNQVVSGVDGGYFESVQPIYRRYDRDSPELKQSSEEDPRPSIVDELGSSPLYEDVRLHKYRWDQRYSRAEYGDLLRSYSGSQAMPEGEREAMIGELCEVIDRDHGGWLTRPLVVTLTVARRAAGAA